MAFNHSDVYSIVAHPTMAPDEKSAAIDMLYGIGAPPPATAPDLRLAEGGPAADTPTVDNAWAQDAGAVNPAQAARAAVASDAMMHPVIPPYHAPAAEPVAEHGAGAAPAPAPAPAPAATGEQPAEPPERDIAPAVREVFADLTTGTPGRRVAAHDQPTATVTEKAAPIPDSVKQAIADDAKKESALALEQGEQAAKGHLDAAIGFDNQAHQARADRAALIEKNQADEEHRKSLDTHFEQLVKDTAVKPSDWWSSKDTGHKILALISAAMFGLAGDPKGLQNVIDADLADKRLNREKLLGARKSAIDGFRARLMSPEAADAAERALAAQAVSAEASRLAEAAKAPEARAAAERIAQDYQTQADLHTEGLAKAEAGTQRTNIAHIPERSTGTPGMSKAAAIAYLVDKLHYKPEDATRAVMGGNYGGGAAADDPKTRVYLPDGSVGYTTEDQHKDTQESLDSLSKLQGGLGRVQELIKSGGHTIAGPDKARIQSVIAGMLPDLSTMMKAGGAQGKVAGEMYDRLAPLTGARALETTTGNATAIAGIQEAARIYGSHLEAIKRRLTPRADTKPVGGKIQTLGKSEKALGFEESGATPEAAAKE